MKETRKIEKYEQAVKNIRNLHSLRMNRGITQQKLSQLSGVSPDTIRNCEYGTYLPTITTYNKLCKVFGWKEITEATTKSIRQLTNTILEDLDELKPVKLPVPVEFTFIEGNNYSIEGADDFIFCYEGKQGIHHMFREVRGNWTQTYTDAQLIGKQVKELD